MRKIALTLLLTTFIGLIGLGWAVDWLYSHYIQDEQDTDTSHYERFGHQLASSIDRLSSINNYIEDWNRDNYSSIKLVLPKELAIPENLLLKLKTGEALTVQSPTSLGIYYYLPEHNEFMLFSPNELQPAIDRSSGSGIFTLVFYSGVLVFLLIWLYPLLSRLSMMSQMTQRLGHGDLSVRMPQSIFSYTQTIETEFNRMATRIENLVTDNKLLSSAVSHDLRTPLARIRFGVDTLSETDDATEKDAHIEHLNQDIDEMESLVEVLLSYSKMNQNSLSNKKLPVDIGSLVSDCIGKIHDSENRVSYLEPTTVVNIDGIEQHLRMLVNNLIQNSLRYGHAKVLVTVENTRKGVKLSVEDDGPGISLEQRTQVLKPFTRGEQSTGGQQGHGMGLAIVDRVVHWHGGTLSITDSTSLGGAMLTVVFS